MNSVSLGDLAQSFVLQRRGADLKAEMTRLNKELVTGQVSDVKSILAGNVSYLAGIENDLRTLDSYRVVTTEAAQFTDAMQNALERVQVASTDYSADLLATAKNASGQVLDQFAVEARAQLQSVVSALNTSVAGRSVFAGTATDAAAIADADTLIAAFTAATAGAGSIDDIVAAADAWFDDPSGFAAAAYLGSDTPLGAFRIGEGETATVPYTANDAALREILKPMLLASVADDNTFAPSADAQRVLLDRAGLMMFEAQTGLTAVRADVGAAQERIDQLATRNAAEATALEYAKGALLGADPYETATKLEEVQFQLQSLYTITARMSDLSLVNFIR